ncbi:MAG TPA: PRC-barrel domain-containing protein [Bacillota bacterium]|jgi:uncharacterized protein YrrD|nr:PRC-barrel domain-containing protein [Peptococcaceae bacterium MAG4]NLW37211.1 photosystem reaction center subunit H [Peptococcaceae bacterium]HPZ42928.1 PRC-barrel domain-containing protein [Bacillota bacterium]HQD75519.1 PRC-barrel domain-containing protein [Bacillota bacterium]HUM58341.1 PRC-barrel domain-containing protein [Bacillota bacterium]
MQKSKRFEAMPVISLEEGRQIGTVKGLVVDPAARKVAALIIEQKGWFKEQRFIPYNRINSVGNDAITIEKSSGIEKAAGIPEIAKLLREKVPINGAKIVTDNGTALGYVDEYYVDLATGTIAGLEFSGSRLDSIIKGHAFIDINYVRTLGKEVIVVSSECLNNIIKLEGGLQETVKNLRESTGQFWENTLQKTKGLGSVINRSLEKVKREKKRDDGQAKEAGPGPISEDMVGEQKKDPFTDSLKADLPEEQVQQQNERQTGPVPTPPEKQAESPRETPPPA